MLLLLLILVLLILQVPSSSIMFAVKTCSKHHTTRVRAIQETWGREYSPPPAPSTDTPTPPPAPLPSQAPHLTIYSDRTDPSVPCTRLEGTVEPEEGMPYFGCNKTVAILTR